MTDMITLLLIITLAGGASMAFMLTYIIIGRILKKGDK